MRTILLILLAAALVSLSFLGPAIAQEEKITVATYYPSPYGVYNEMNTNILYFVPQDPARTRCEKEGQVFYDIVKHMLMVCKGVGQPVPVAGEINVQPVGLATLPMNSPNNGLFGYGRTVNCPPGTKLVGTAWGFGQAIGPHHINYTKPNATGDGMSCFNTAALGLWMGPRGIGSTTRNNSGCGSGWSAARCAANESCGAICTQAQ